MSVRPKKETSDPALPHVEQVHGGFGCPSAPAILDEDADECADQGRNLGQSVIDEVSRLESGVVDHQVTTEQCQPKADVDHRNVDLVFGPGEPDVQGNEGEGHQQDAHENSHKSSDSC